MPLQINSHDLLVHEELEVCDDAYYTLNANKPVKHQQMNRNSLYFLLLLKLIIHGLH